MSLYNHIIVEDVVCPRCNSAIETLETECRIGWYEFVNYRVGDRVKWAERKQQGAKRPANGSASFKAYAVCPVCEQDFWLKVEVTNDVIASLAPILPSTDGSVAGESWDW